MPAAAVRTMTVLTSLTKAPGPCTVSELSSATGIARASLVRLLKSLAEEGAVRTDDAGRYEPTMLLWQLGMATLRRRNVRDIACPYLIELARRIPSQVNLGLPEFPRGMVVESWNSMGGPVTSTMNDATFHLLSTAIGRVIAAHESEAFQDAILKIPVPKTAQRSRTDPADLREELARIRDQGYATIDRENVDDISGFAVPLFGATGRPVASIGFSRRSPLDWEFVRQYTPVARDICERISAELGFRRSGGDNIS